MSQEKVYIALEISGSPKAYRDDLFSQVDHIDEYTWYANLDGSESDTGDHYIVVRGNSKTISDVLEKLNDKHRFTPVEYVVQDKQKVLDRFASKDHESTLINILTQIAECQNLGPPYSGWDLDKLKSLVGSLDLTYINCAARWSRSIKLIGDFVEAFDRVGSNSISVTAIGKAARPIRDYLGLAQPEEVDPEVARMIRLMKGVLDRNPLRDLIEDQNRVQKE